MFSVLLVGMALSRILPSMEQTSEAGKVVLETISNLGFVIHFKFGRSFHP